MNKRQTLKDKQIEKQQLEQWQSTRPTTLSPSEDAAARKRCKQLLESGYGAITWEELLGER